MARRALRSRRTIRFLRLTQKLILSELKVPPDGHTHRLATYAAKDYTLYIARQDKEYKLDDVFGDYGPPVNQEYFTRKALPLPQLALGVKMVSRFFFA